jgi:hypothetical protein
MSRGEAVAQGCRDPRGYGTGNCRTDETASGMEQNREAKESRGDTRQAKYNRGPFDIATLAIFPEYIEFDGGEVLRLVVEGAAGRTVA